MKRKTAIYAVTAIAALSFASEVLAKGGSMGGGQSHGSTGGTHQMASTMLPASGSGMQQHTMSGNVSQQGSAAGSKSMKSSGSVSSKGHQYVQMNGNAAGPTTKHSPVTTATN